MMNANLNPTKVDREDEKRMLPCRFFVNGFCHRGLRCRFYHPTPGAVKTCIRVPALPPGFGHGVTTSNSSHSQQMNHMRRPPQEFQQMRMDQRMRTNSGSSSRMGPGGRGPMPPNMPPGMNGNFGYQNRPMRMRSYNDYDFDYSSQGSPCDSSSSDLSVAASEQNTFFTHINWREFLAPGQAPPPPTKVPEETPASPRDTDVHSSGDRNGILRPLGSQARKVANDDMPPEGSQCGPGEGQGEPGRKLTPREELQMKVKQIAKDLAAEPQSPKPDLLDSYFLNFDFAKAGFSAVPCPMEMDQQLQPKAITGNKKAVRMEESPRNQIATALVESMEAKPKQKPKKETKESSKGPQPSRKSH